jgi:putative transcriptional regulator
LYCRLKVILAERNLKQKELSEMTGIGKSHMSQIVNGQIIPTLDVAFKIAAVLGLTVHDIWEPEETQ